MFDNTDHWKKYLELLRQQSDLRKLVEEMRNYADYWAAWDKAEIVAEFAKDLELLLDGGE